MGSSFWVMRSSVVMVMTLNDLGLGVVCLDYQRFCLFQQLVHLVQLALGHSGQCFIDLVAAIACVHDDFHRHHIDIALFVFFHRMLPRLHFPLILLETIMPLLQPWQPS